MRSLSSVIFFFFITGYSLVGFAHNWDAKELPVIEVSASAKAKALPDQVELNITFSDTNVVAKKARKTVDKNVLSFLQSLENYDIQEKSLDSSQTQIYPQYEYRGSKKTFLGHQVTRKVNFKLNTLSELEDIIQLVTDNKASELGHLNFTLKNAQKVKRQALKKAINKARKDAAVIAESFGVDIGKLHKVVHSDDTRNTPIMRRMSVSAEMSDSQSNSYQQKELEFSASVTASFLID